MNTTETIVAPLDHIDSIGGIITRSAALLKFATHELLNQRTLPDDHLARLLWQIEENMESLKAETDALWEKMKQGMR